VGVSIEKTVNYSASDLYQKAFRLALYAHEVTMGLSEADRMGLAPDMVESAMAIPSSIANGCRSRSARAVRANLIIAFSKCGRLVCQLSLFHDLKHIGTGDYDKALALEEDVSRTLLRMIKEVNV
jgi:four helix bundle protein